MYASDCIIILKFYVIELLSYTELLIYFLSCLLVLSITIKILRAFFSRKSNIFIILFISTHSRYYPTMDTQQYNNIKIVYTWNKYYDKKYQPIYSSLCIHSSCAFYSYGISVPNIVVLLPYA